MAVSVKQKFRFGPFVLDVHSGELYKHDYKLKVQPQPIQVLTLLLEHPGDLVTREELQKRIWPSDTFVDFEHGLNTAVKKLRQALGDESETPKYIETLLRKGYRFVSPVESFTPLPPTGPELRSWRVWTITGSIAALVLTLALFIFVRALGISLHDPPQIKSMAVLPLVDLSQNSDQQYFADAMTDALITSLAKPGAIRITSRTSVMAYKSRYESVQKIGKELNVDAVITGTVQRSGDQVRVTAQLIYAPLDRHLWTNTFDGNLRDVFALQTEIAQAIAKQIKLKLGPNGKTAYEKVCPVDPEAYDLYAKGRYQYAGWQNVDKAAESFKHAIDKDPAFAPAYAGLAMSYSILGFFQEPTKAYLKARTAADQALRLDPSLAEGYAATADINYRYEWDWIRAEENFRTALELNPVDAQLHDRYAMYLTVVGRFREAIDEAKKAEYLDPPSVEAKLTLATVYQKARRYDESIQRYREVLTVNPAEGVALGQLPWVLTFKGNYEEALRTYRPTGQPDPFLAYMYGVSGRRAEALDIVRALKSSPANAYVSPVGTAVAYLGLDDKEKALDMLNKAYEERDQQLMLLKVDPWFDKLRPDPRFQELLRRMQFPKA